MTVDRPFSDTLKECSLMSKIYYHEKERLENLVRAENCRIERAGFIKEGLYNVRMIKKLKGELEQWLNEKRKKRVG